MSTLGMPRNSLSAGQLPGRHRARLARARLRRRFRQGITHRIRRQLYPRPLLCASMRRRDVILLVTLITAIWLAVRVA